MYSFLLGRVVELVRMLVSRVVLVVVVISSEDRVKSSSLADRAEKCDTPA